ncbi:hypothetical protein H2198_008992 [Neophaeococcomyces mojaviensis]|uniref:Uncharacterized protein n=1 Tax=Neophaeococcomyces mojaviensis TaxID=3383035 RepID=A0ACC2ZVQ8_9EURO|nr:hypothetical protein H2198_008992 [Knufia sp. JES_112]
MPYCGTYILLAGSTRYTAYFCSNVRASAALTVLTTWTTTGPATARTTASTTTPPRSITPPITTPNPTTTTSNTITSSPTGPISSHDAHPDHKNVGAIAGGVVGGIVALAGIVGVIIFFLRRKKKSERQQTRLEISQAPH